MKILFFDLETAPNTAFVWGLWQQDVALSQVISSSHVLCWSAKWQGEKRVMFDSVHQSPRKRMLKGIHKLLDEADCVVHYNGKKFDSPVLNREFLLAGMAPPAPFVQVDMLQVARSAFRFQSNKLAYVAQELGLGCKTPHEGFRLWVKCMENDPVAWRKMRAYNIQDTVLLEKVYNKMLPWIKGHPNRSSYDGKTACPHCGGGKFQLRGTAVSAKGRYPRLQCKSCGAWARGPTLAEKNGGGMVAL